MVTQSYSFDMLPNFTLHLLNRSLKSLDGNENQKVGSPNKSSDLYKVFLKPKNIDREWLFENSGCFMKLQLKHRKCHNALTYNLISLVWA